MKDANMDDSKAIDNCNADEASLDFCTGDDFITVSHSTAMVSPSGAEFDLIVKVCTYFRDVSKKYADFCRSKQHIVIKGI